MFHGFDIIQLHFMALCFSPSAVSHCNVALPSYWERYFFLYRSWSFEAQYVLTHRFSFREPSLRASMWRTRCCLGLWCCWWISLWKVHWLYFPKYLLSYWVVHISGPKNIFQRCCTVYRTVPYWTCKHLIQRKWPITIQNTKQKPRRTQVAARKRFGTIKNWMSSYERV